MAFIELEYKSLALMRGVSVKVILPDNLLPGEDIRPPYKTLYFLPGYSATASELCSYLSLRKQADLKGVAIVIVNGENLFYIDHPERNTSFSTYVGKELVDMTRKLLPLSDKREDTYIGGISMGGYGALYNGLRFRNTFSKIAAMSPAIDVEAIMHDIPEAGFPKGLFENLFGNEEAYKSGNTNIIKEFVESGGRTRPELFLCCGRQDVLVYEQNKEFAQTLEQKGIPHIYREAEGNHDLDFWERMMDPVFSFLTGIDEGTKDRLTI